MTKLYKIEKLHLLTGLLLILGGIISYYQDGIFNMLSWSIFGVMYISMSDVGESKISNVEKQLFNHRLRVLAAYLGATLSMIFVIFLLLNIYK